MLLRLNRLGVYIKMTLMQFKRDLNTKNSTLSPHCAYHIVVSFPYAGAFTIAQRTRTLITVTSAFNAVERHMIIGPGDATSEARTHVGAQLLDGQHIVIGRR